MTFVDAVGVLACAGCIASYALGYVMGRTWVRRHERRAGIFHHVGDVVLLHDGTIGRVESVVQ